ncbi:MAG: hypothetical protein DMG65_00560 [Candidatus Angelobacter sp. Gp1-AA117]|nr:MAG: hypothetical protein DMG65_00560 [Candidatus Angelobacter sp. Gp1-AA117]
MRYEDNPNTKLDQALAAARAQQPGPEIMKAASERVWQHLNEQMQNGPAAAVEAIHGCEDVRTLLPEYQAGKLSSARALLVEDHLHECAACHREAEKNKSSVLLLPWKQELPKVRQGHFRWAAMAAAVVLFTFIGYMIEDRLAVPSGSRAQVESVNGNLFLVSASSEKPLQPGAQLAEGEKVRTAGGAHAMLRLSDGSLVEMNERAEFSVSQRFRDTTIHLNRGDIIVQAAKRTSGHLYVAAPDCTVSVTGTVFAVKSGMKGSRVSVIEGEVRVAYAGATNVLHPGDQLATAEAVGTVPVKQEIAWSQNLDKHLALLAAFAHLQNRLEHEVQLPGLRYESKLLPLLPQSTILYAGIPNLGDAIQQANQLFQQELQQSAVLNEWWQQTHAGKNGNDFQQAIERIHQLGQYLGNEIVFSIGGEGENYRPLLVAQVQKPGLKEFIQQLTANHANHGLQVLDEQELTQTTVPANEHGLFIVVRSDMVIASPDINFLRSFDAQLQQGGGGFAATPFGQRLTQAYNGGTELLFGANLQEMEHRRSYGTGRRQAAFQQTGFADLQYLVVERKDLPAQTLNNAELTFTGPRHGFASWLSAPASIGGLDFVSPNAGLVGALVSKSGAEKYEDVINFITASGEDANAHIAKVETELRIRLREDLANTLGGEITFALDGPLLPTPSWKIIAEVYDSARLQQSIQQIIQDANSHTNDGRSVTLEDQVVDGITYHTLNFPEAGKLGGITYAFTDGYMILGPSRAMVMDAIHTHQSGNSLAKSGDFHKLLPQDQFTNVSALLYQNLAPVIGPVAQQLTRSQLESLKAIAAETKPSLVCAYGEESSIRVASTSKYFGLDLNSLALSTLLKLGQQRPKTNQY